MSTGSHSEFLRFKLSFASSQLADVGRSLWDHPGLAELFPRYLMVLHGIIRASVPLMEAARSRAELMGDSDPTARDFIDYLSKHIPEERRHDDWLLDDLAALGLSREAVLARTPTPTIASLVGAQYYWIFHHHPVALLGYIAFLEGNPPSVERLEEIKARTGLPSAAFRTCLKHAHLDVAHRDDLDRFLDGLPLSPEQTSLVGLSACWTQHLFGRVLSEQIERFEDGQRRSRALDPLTEVGTS